MPVFSAVDSLTGRPGFQWGAAGKVFTYRPGDPTGEARARAAAERQGRAMRARQRADLRVLSGPLGALRVDAPQRRVRAPKYPRSWENRYRAMLLRRARAVHTLVMEQLDPILAQAATPERADADEDRPQVSPSIAEDLRRIIRVVVEVVAESMAPDPDDVATIAAGVEAYATREQMRVLETVASIDLSAALGAASEAQARFLLAGFVADNVSLIKSIDTRYFGEIEDLVMEAARTGRSTLDLRDDIERRYQVSRSRAELIARDQVGKANGAVSHRVQTGLGVASYMWSTSGDERVRDLHRDLDGEIFAWSAPPVSGTNGERAHPGQPIACRCVPIPVLDDADAAALQEKQRQREQREAAFAGAGGTVAGLPRLPGQ